MLKREDITVKQLFLAERDSLQEEVLNIAKDIVSFMKQSLIEGTNHLSYIESIQHSIGKSSITHTAVIEFHINDNTNATLYGSMNIASLDYLSSLVDTVLRFNNELKINSVKITKTATGYFVKVYMDISID